MYVCMYEIIIIIIVLKMQENEVNEMIKHLIHGPMTHR